MKVERMDWITREIVRANPDKAFLFGDNLSRKGYGGQAREMRGEPNAFGISTKITPFMDDKAFFSDNRPFVKDCIDLDFETLLNSDFQTVVIPSDGIGTGLAELDKRAPRTFAYLQKRLKDLEDL